MVSVTLMHLCGL